MPKTISKTFRLSPQLAREIEQEADKINLSQGAYLDFIFSENKKLKMRKEFHENLRFLQHDKAYQKEQSDLAQADFL